MNVKKILAAFAAILLLALPCLSVAETVVTSFYPIWLFALNLTDGIEEIDVQNLAAPDTGCLHDYQLQTGDMKTLADADLFLVNGAGMESYLDIVFRAFPDLPVIEASENIPLLAEGDALEIGEGEHAEDGEAEVNAHIWLDASNAVQMVRSLSDGLEKQFPHYAETIAANREAYIARLEQLHKQLQAGLADTGRKDIVTFHEAFPYFAEAYNLHVAAVVNREPGETLTPAQMAELIVMVQKLGNPPLFVEPQYEDLSARTLAQETGAPVYTLDPVVTGPEADVPLDYYETKMLENMAVLQEALR